MLGPLRLIVWLVGFTVLALPTAALVLFLLAVVGSPGSCGLGDGETAVEPLLAASFQTKWDQLNATLDAGQTSTITIDERETTARARLWVEEHQAPVQNLLICFDLGGGAASGKVDIPFFPGDVDVLVRGTVDLTGEHPQADIESIEIGGLPGPLTRLVRRFVNRVIDEETEQVDLRHDYGLSFGEGTATISGQP